MTHERGAVRVAPNGQDLPTACCLCSHNCGLRVDVEDGKIRAIRSDPSNPITHGYICNKGHSIPHYIDHAQRVRYPLKRMPDGSFARIGWDQAVREIGHKLRDLRRVHSPRSIALMGVGGQGNHLDAAYAIAFLKALGSPWWFSAFAQEKTQHPLVDKWMAGAPPTVFLHADAEHAEYVLMLGTNPLVSNRGRNPLEVIRAIGADPARRLVVVDPRQTETTRKADRHLRVRPGTDAYLLLGMLHTIVERKLHDADFVAAHTRDFDRLASVLRAVDLGEMARRTGLTIEEIETVATEFATAPTACVFFDLGVEQVPFSTLVAYLMRLLLAVTGNYARTGGNTFASSFSPAAKFLAEKEMFRAPVSGIEAIAALGGFGMMPPNILPEEIEGEHPEHIRAVIVEGANPLLSYADTAAYRRALAKLDLLVVIDPAMTETARAAHYVLPAPVGYEKWEWSSFPNGYPEVNVQLRPPVVQGPEEALPEAEIYARLAEATGIVAKTPAILKTLGRFARTKLGGPAYQATAAGLATLHGRGDKMGTMARLLVWNYRAVGPHLPGAAAASLWSLAHLVALTRRGDVLRALGGEVGDLKGLALGEAIFQRILDHPEGVEVARVDPARDYERNVTYDDKRLRLAPEPMMREMERALREPPVLPEGAFVLYTGRRTHWNANTIHRDPQWRKGKGPHFFAEIHPDDAARLGVAAGDRVRLVTDRGALEAPVVIQPGVALGQIAVPHGFGQRYPDATGELVADGANVNELTDARWRDPFTGTPYHKWVPCRVERVEAAG